MTKDLSKKRTKNTQEIWQLLERMLYLQACRNELHIGALKQCVRKNGGLGKLAPGKFFMIMPFRSLENAPFLENVPLREAQDQN